MPKPHCSRTMFFAKLAMSAIAYTQGVVYLCMLSATQLIEPNIRKDDDFNQSDLKKNLTTPANHTHPFDRITTDITTAHENTKQLLCNTSIQTKIIGLTASFICCIPPFFFAFKALHKKTTRQQRLIQVVLTIPMLPVGMLNGEINSQGNTYLWQKCAEDAYSSSAPLISKTVCLTLSAFLSSIILSSHLERKIEDLRYLFNYTNQTTAEQIEKERICFYASKKELSNTTPASPIDHVNIKKKLKTKMALHLALLIPCGVFMWTLSCRVFYDYAHTAAQEYLEPTLPASFIADLAWHMSSFSFSLLLNDTFLLPRRPDLFSDQRKSTTAIILFLSILTAIPYYVLFHEPGKALSETLTKGSSFVLMQLLWTSYGLIDPINAALNKSPCSQGNIHTRQELTESAFDRKVITVRTKPTPP